MWKILVQQGIKNGKVTLKYHKEIRNYKWYCSFELGKKNVVKALIIISRLGSNFVK